MNKLIVVIRNKAIIYR